MIGLRGVILLETGQHRSTTYIPDDKKSSRRTDRIQRSSRGFARDHLSIAERVVSLDNTCATYKTCYAFFTRTRVISVWYERKKESPTVEIIEKTKKEEGLENTVRSRETDTPRYFFSSSFPYRSNSYRSRGPECMYGISLPIDTVPRGKGSSKCK